MHYSKIKVTLKHLFLLIFTLFSYTYSSAQYDQSYTIDNRTDQIPPFKISIAPFNFEQIFVPLTSGISFEGHIKNKLFYDLHYRMGFMRTIMITEQEMESTQEESYGRLTEIGCYLVFRDRKKKGKLRIVTANSSGSRDMQSYFMAACDHRKMWALALGGMNYNRAKYLSRDSSEYVISGSNHLIPKDQKFIHFNQTTTAIYGGLVRRKIKKAMVVSEGKTYKKYLSTKFYMHAIYGNTKIEDIILNNTTYKIDNFTQIPFGYRMGWQWDQKRTEVCFEFGKMPGVFLKTPFEKKDPDLIIKDNPYLNYARLTVHFNLISGERWLEKQRKRKAAEPKK